MGVEGRADLTVEYLFFLSNKDSQSDEFLDERYMALVMHVVPMEAWFEAIKRILQ